MAFLLGEDKALREKLSGMTVSDQKSDGQETARPVKVWFGQPDQELTNQSYPYITIDMIDVVRDTQREVRGKSRPDYISGPELGLADDWLMDTPIPVFIDYQITSYARHPRHDRQILAQLVGVKLPIRFGILNVLENTENVGGDVVNTITTRRLDVMSVNKRDVTEQAKRLFVNAITVRVSSEIPLEIFEILYRVTEIDIDEISETRGGFTSVGPIIITQPPVTP
jgi:hypothetical protein